MNVELYKELTAKERVFADLLLEIGRDLRRLADLMDREIKGEGELK